MYCFQKEKKRKKENKNSFHNTKYKMMLFIFSKTIDNNSFKKQALILSLSPPLPLTFKTKLESTSLPTLRIQERAHLFPKRTRREKGISKFWKNLEGIPFTIIENVVINMYGLLYLTFD